MLRGLLLLLVLLTAAECTYSVYKAVSSTECVPHPESECQAWKSFGTPEFVNFYCDDTGCSMFYYADEHCNSNATIIPYALPVARLDCDTMLQMFVDNNRANAAYPTTAVFGTQAQ